MIKLLQSTSARRRVVLAIWAVNLIILGATLAFTLR